MLCRRAPYTFAGLVLLAAAPLLFAGAYAAESDATRYFLPAYFVLVAVAAYGVAVLDDALRGPARYAALGAIVAAWAVLLAGDVVAGEPLFAQPADRGAHDWIDRVARATPPHAIVVASWDDATPLAYGAYVLHALGDRIVLTADAHEFEHDYRRWLRARPIVVVAGERPSFAGLHVREIGRGDPHLYALR
jgi:hypothetical protein